MALTTFVSGNTLLASQLNDSFAAVGGWRIVQNETAFTAATAIVANANIFTSAYTNYKIVMRFTGTTGGGLGLRLRVAGVAAATNYNQQFLTASSTTLTGVRQTAQTSYAIGAGSTGTFFQSVECLVTGPALAEGTTFLTNFQISDAAYTVPSVQFNFGNHSTATAYDSFEMNAASGNFTGTYTVYGLVKTGV